MPTKRSSRASARSSSSSAKRRSSRGGKDAIATTDHDEIRQWVEDRGGHPACVRGTGGGEDIGMLRIDFPGYSGKQSLQEIGWDDFFEKFDERELAFLHQDQTSGGQRSNFNKLIARRGAGGKTRSTRTRSRAGTRSKSRTSKRSSTRAGARSKSRTARSKSHSARGKSSSAAGSRRRSASHGRSAR